MNKKIAIIQSSYIPWKGYFDIINMVDEFIVFDDVQYTRRDWRNRNLIKTEKGLTWLTIPVEVKGKYFQTIKDTVISEEDWNKKHWQSILRCYGKAPQFKQGREFLEELYLGSKEKYLSLINYRFIKGICDFLEIKTNIKWSMDYKVIDGKTERLVDLCKKAGATEYISGPSAKTYVVEELFALENIKLNWMDYSGYPEYPQMYPPFEHGVSIVDLIMNMGIDAKKYMKSFAKQDNY